MSLKEDIWGPKNWHVVYISIYTHLMIGLQIVHLQKVHHNNCLLINCPFLHAVSPTAKRLPVQKCLFKNNHLRRQEMWMKMKKNIFANVIWKHDKEMKFSIMKWSICGHTHVIGKMLHGCYEQCKAAVLLFCIWYICTYLDRLLLCSIHLVITYVICILYNVYWAVILDTYIWLIM